MTGQAPNPNNRARLNAYKSTGVLHSALELRRRRDNQQVEFCRQKRDKGTAKWRGMCLRTINLSKDEQEGEDDIGELLSGGTIRSMQASPHPSPIHYEDFSPCSTMV